MPSVQGVGDTLWPASWAQKKTESIRLDSIDSALLPFGQAFAARSVDPTAEALGFCLCPPVKGLHDVSSYKQHATFVSVAHHQLMGLYNSLPLQRIAEARSQESPSPFLCGRSLLSTEREAGRRTRSVFQRPCVVSHMCFLNATP